MYSYVIRWCNSQLDRYDQARRELMRSVSISKFSLQKTHKKGANCVHFFGTLISNVKKMALKFRKVRTPVSIRLRPDPVDCGPLAFHNIFTTRMDSCRPISAAYQHFSIFRLGEDGIVAVNLYQAYQFPSWLPIFEGVAMMCHDCRARPFDLASSGRTVCEGLVCNVQSGTTFLTLSLYFYPMVYPRFLRVIHHDLFVFLS